MKFASIIGRFARSVDSFFTEEVEIVDGKYTKKIRSAEKQVFSQGSVATNKYWKAISKLDNNYLEITDEAVFSSIRSRNNRTFNFSPSFYEIINDPIISSVFNRNLADYKELHGEFCNIDLNQLCYEIYKEIHSEWEWEFYEYFTKVKSELQKKRIYQLLVNLNSKTYNFFHYLSIQIPLIYSFTEFFDQIFSLKKDELNAIFTFESFFNKINKIRYNERQILGLIPVAC